MMLERADRHVLFDARFFNINQDPVFDVSLYKAEYGGQETPLMFSPYQPVLTHIVSHSKVEEVQLCAYRSRPDPHQLIAELRCPIAIYLASLKVGRRGGQQSL